MRRPVGVKSVLRVCLTRCFSSAEFAAVAMLPFALSRSDFIRSVHVGRSRLSRRCHLISALWFSSACESNLGQAIDAVTGIRLEPDCWVTI